MTLPSKGSAVDFVCPGGVEVSQHFPGVQISIFHVVVVFTVMAFCANPNVGSSQFALFCSLMLHVSASKVLVQDSFQRLTCNSSQQLLGSSKSRLTRVKKLSSIVYVRCSQLKVPGHGCSPRVDHHSEVSINLPSQETPLRLSDLLCGSAGDVERPRGR